jgi:exodeoxyribonuclease X
MDLDHLIVLDTETSGLKDPVGVCEIGIIELDVTTLAEVGRFRSLIDPQVPISHAASGVHRITDDMVGDAPTLEEYFHIVLEHRYTDKNVLMVAHNKSFDYPKVKQYLGNSQALCTLRLAQKAWPDAENHKLATLKFMYKLGRMGSTSHNALADVEDTADLLRLLKFTTGLSLQELLEFEVAPRIVEIMPFSKHKDSPLKDVPKSFWTWLLKQGGEGVDPDLAYSVNLIHPDIKLKEKA